MPIFANGPAIERVKIGRHTLFRGDSVDVLQSIECGTVDVVVTSPPYNLGVRYDHYGDDRAEGEYLDWLCTVFGHVAVLLKPGGSLFLNIGASSVKPWLPFELPIRLRAMRNGAGEPVWQLQNHIVWVKSISIEESTWGQLKPINSDRFLNHTHETLLHLTRSGRTPLDRLAIGVPYADKTNIRRFGAEGRPDKRCRGNVWFIPYDTVQSRDEKFSHPATFPVALPEMCIRLHGVHDAVVLDPFSGVAATVLAAERTGSRGIGIELSDTYHTAAVKRIEDVLARHA